jgi:hypothetical protein
MGFANGKYNINDSPAANSEGEKKKKAVTPVKNLGYDFKIFFFTYIVLACLYAVRMLNYNI